MKTHTIQDKTRKITVLGDKIASSSSYQPWKTRWIKFDLYKTESGKYVLHRVGMSRVYHTSECDTTINNSLDPEKVSSLGSGWVPCRLCQPDSQGVYVFPESNRYFVVTCPDPGGVLESVSMYDKSTGSRYYTDVAIDLIEKACEVDEDLSMEYYGDDSVIL